MNISRWQRQHVHFRRIVWTTSAGLSILLTIILLALGMTVDVAGVFFIIFFVTIRIALAFLLKNRYANAMVRTLAFDYEEIERDFRFVFKHESIRYYRKIEANAYHYEFPGRNLSMMVQPHYPFYDLNAPPVTKVTLSLVNEENKAFADRLAKSIDDMADRRASAMAHA